jgi:tetratricopeptide (TPR) repeat protein
VDDLCLAGEVISGQRIQDEADVATLTTEEWLERWGRFRAQPGQDPLAPPADDGWRWHRQQADLYEAEGRWQAVIWQLRYLIAASPKDWQLYRRRAHAHAALSQWQDALADYSKAIAQGADEWPVWRDRGLAYAETRQWQKATGDFATAIRQGARDDAVFSLHALLCLGAGDHTAYRRACADMLAHFGRTDNLKIANQVAWVCTYAPGAAGDFGPILRLAERAAAKHPKTYATLNTLGGVLIRAGQWQRAAETLDRAVKVHPQGGNAFDFLFLAMAQAHLGHADLARRYLDKADEWIEQARRGEITDPSLQVPLNWVQRLELDLFRPEAGALVKAVGARSK